MGHESFFPVVVLNTPNHGAKLSFVNNVSGNHTWARKGRRSTHHRANVWRKATEAYPSRLLVSSRIHRYEWLG